MQCTLYKAVTKHNSLFDKQFIIKKLLCEMKYILLNYTTLLETFFNTVVI